MEPQTPKTFHRFLKLPPELRLMVWESAARNPEAPWVNFFSVWNPDAAKVEGAFEPLLFPDIDHSKPRALWECLGPPGGRTTTSARRCSWSDNNASAYLIDFGLWTACRESRAVMDRLYRSGPLDPLVRRSRQYGPWSDYAAAWVPHTADQPRHKIVMSLSGDLLCLTNVSIHGLDSWPLCRDGYPGASGFAELTNVAVPYHPGWDILTDDNSADEWTAYWKYLCCWVHNRLVPYSHLWLIDYRIRIGSRGLESLQKKGHIVFHGKGLRLVEIREPAGAGSRVARAQNALDFAVFFRKTLRRRRQDILNNVSFLTSAKIGILACVFDNKSRDKTAMRAGVAVEAEEP